MPNITLPIIQKPTEGTRSVLQRKAKPFIKGKGQINYLCGGCGETLLENVEAGQIKNIVIRCPTCGNYNDLVQNGLHSKATLGKRT